VTREAQQLHGGYGYAEEYTVSRLFVDARVLSIFEGADEVLALRVIARTVLGDALSREGATVS
jgi:(2S)-methylsuccinyl-CoA dehydrogenase